MIIQPFDYEVQWRPGKLHTVADVPSRFPMKTTEDRSGARIDFDIAEINSFMINLAGECQENETTKSVKVSMTGTNGLLGMVTTHKSLNDELDDEFYDQCCTAGCNVLSYIKGAGIPADVKQCRESLAQVGLKAASAAYVGRERHPDVFNVPNDSDDPTVGDEPVGNEFFKDAEENGIVLVELCGGISAGLEAVVGNGIKVARYIYADLDPDAVAIAKHRIRMIQMEHPDMISDEALEHTFDSIPMDVNKVTKTQILACSEARLPVLIIAGWPCQDLSPAGDKRGIKNA